MGLLDESYATLLAPLRRPCASTEKERQHDRIFDMLDCMEKGLAREQVADFIEPLPESSSLWKFHVERSEDRQQYRLFCDNGDFLMYARVARSTRRIDFFLYDPKQPGSALLDLAHPAFTLVCNTSKTEWRLLQARCDHCRNAPSEVRCSCRGKQEKMVVRHSAVDVGDGVNHAMDVQMAPDGCSGIERRIVSKLPVWNDKVDCLVLDFKGRKILASAKNFQLALGGDATERVICQFGKLAPNRFSLDFRYPLTVIQAFSLALTTLFWV